MTIDEHIEHNTKILKDIMGIIKNNDLIGGPYVWFHEIFALEDGLYKPKGLLALPFAIENFGDSHHMYSYFDKRFITGEGVVDPRAVNYGKCIDPMSWENNLRIQDGDIYEIHDKDVALGDILQGVNSMIKRYFELRKTLKSSSVPEDDLGKKSYALAMNCFTEY